MACESFCDELFNSTYASIYLLRFVWSEFLCCLWPTSASSKFPSSFSSVYLLRKERWHCPRCPSVRLSASVCLSVCPLPKHFKSWLTVTKHVWEQPCLKISSWLTFGKPPLMTDLMTITKEKTFSVDDSERRVEKPAARWGQKGQRSRRWFQGIWKRLEGVRRRPKCF